MSEEIKLLPCPFCGGTELYDDDQRVQCNDCFAESPVTAWNTRAHDGDGWRDIESAPKDGTRIDLWVEHVSGLGELTAKRFTNAKWYDGGWTDNYGNKLEWKVNPSDVEEGCSPNEGRRVTHWRPLPAPPQSTLEQEKRP